jgi:Spy/CpxP family protein refolding chaperone
MKRSLVWTLAAASLVGVAVAAVLMVTDQVAGARPQAPWADADQPDTTDVLAQGPAPAVPGAAPAVPDLRRRLNLTDEQARRVEQIMGNYRQQTERLRIDLARARLDAREVFLAATPDRARLETIARRIGDLQGQLTRARFNMLAELKAVLSPEQWNRLRVLEGPRGRLRRMR